MTTATQVASPANDAALSRVLATLAVDDATSQLIEVRIVGRNGSDGTPFGAVLYACASRHNEELTVSDVTVLYRSVACPTPILTAGNETVILSMPRADGDVVWRATLGSLGTI